MSAYYRASLPAFLADESQRILGGLTARTEHNKLLRQQIKAWEKEIVVLKTVGHELLLRFPTTQHWAVLLEYPIPRRRKRLDVVLLATDVIFCLEFKTGDATHSLQAQRQVEDYALDLRDFHEASRGRRIVPIVVVPKAPTVKQETYDAGTDDVRSIILANAHDLASVLLNAFQAEHQPTAIPVDASAWDNSPYRPVPTIIEAAEALFAGHNVREIAHSHAGAINLTATSDRLVEIIQTAQLKREKVVCFVTGVPGAGKTLAGLNVVHNPVLRREGRPAGVFLSGNGPLVRIVSAALARDHRRRVRTGDETRTVSTFVQNVHIFLREGIDKPNNSSVENVVVFDEAQRAWNAEQNRRKNDIEESEPEQMLRIMDRHKDWAVIIALVGGGQEINSGEAGLSEWGQTIRDKFPNWKVSVSPQAVNADASLSGRRLFADGNSGSLDIRLEPSLHLEVNLRSFRARKLAEWVDAVLDLKVDLALSLTEDLKEFPLVMTRSLATARSWLQNKTRGQRRCGLVASSGALRLRAEGIELSSGFRQGNRDMFVHWFLAAPPDVRASNQLEIAASEYECQGLELDWIGLCWAGDFTFEPTAVAWNHRHFSGSRWGNINKEIDRDYLLNTYRVLLTRAREGMVIWIPTGDDHDETRPKSGFDLTSDYLLRCGLTLI